MQNVLNFNLREDIKPLILDSEGNEEYIGYTLMYFFVCIHFLGERLGTCFGVKIFANSV